MVQKTPEVLCLLVTRNYIERSIALTKEFVENAVQILVTRYIPLNPLDLEEWMADPEGWVNVEEQDNEQWVFEIRVSTNILTSVDCDLIYTHYILASLVQNASS